MEALGAVGSLVFNHSHNDGFASGNGRYLLQSS